MLGGPLPAETPVLPSASGFGHTGLLYDFATACMRPACFGKAASSARAQVDIALRSPIGSMLNRL